MEKENSMDYIDKTRIKDPAAVAGDLKFMRSVIEKTYRLYDPRWPVMIVWGLIFLTGMSLTQYCLAKSQFKEFIQPMWIILWVIGAAVGIFDGCRCERRERKTGHVSRLSNQLGLIWYILLLNGSLWPIGPFSVFFGKQAFLWAAIFGFGLSVSGILSSREWLFGGVAILISILAASLIKEYAYVILGIAIGLGCIIPALIIKRNYRNQEKGNG
ncbi:MAG: hypothetical protein JW715_17230 [Sedimentisphaerales bacterium]|nr:hypothetical protein [Sedimentisphaerales bacterium]